MGLTIFCVRYCVILLSTLILFSEYIVVFIKYYSARARQNFIGAALQDGGVVSWQIVPRNNVLATTPSDFDVIKVIIY